VTFFRLVRAVLPVPLAVTAVVLLARSDEDRVGALGLITAIPPAVIALVLALVMLYLLELNDRPRSVVLGVILVGVIVVLYGAPALVETEPRFATAYAHAGFVDHIYRNGEVLKQFDARFSWPGFFAAAASVLHFSGLSTALPLLAWAPVMMELLFLPPLLLIGRQLVPNARSRALGILLFYLVNWVGQDYFAPQAVAFLLYLVVIATLLRWFRLPELRPGEAASSGVFSWLAALPSRALRFLGPDERSPPTAQVWQLRALHGAIVVMVAAMTVSHQLTPFALGFVAGALVLFRLCRLRSLPFLIAVMVLAWLSFAATDFWVGHLRDVTGGVGDVGGNVTSNVGQRITGSAEHLVVLRLRMAVTLGLWGAAAWAVLRPARRLGARRSVVVLAVAAFPVLGLNSYGGEALLRVFFYTLPFMSLLAAETLWNPRWRAGERGRRRFPVAAATALLLLAGLFPVVRYGNERFEMVRPGEMQALAYLYDNARPGATLLSITGSLPWRYRDVEKFQYGSALPVLYPLDVRALERRLRADPEGAFLVITTSQVYEAVDTQGVEPGWAPELSRALRSTPTLDVVFESDSAYVVSPVLGERIGKGDR
jgi:hypothetical protein